MPNIFEALSAGQAPPTAPQQPASEAPPPVPQKNIFEVLSGNPEEQSEANAATHELDENAQAPAAPRAAWSAVPQPVQAQPAYGPRTGTALGNFATAAFNTAGNTLGNFGARVAGDIGILSPEQVQQMMQTPVAPPARPGLSRTLGNLVGGIAPVIASGPLAPATMAIQGGEGRLEDIEARRAAGQDISPGQAAGYLGAGTALDVGMGMLAPGGQAGKALMKVLPRTGNALADAALRTATAAGVSAPEMGAYQAVGNLARRASGVNPTQSLSEGVPEAALQGGLLGATGQGLHDLISPPKAPVPTPKAPEGFGLKTPEEMDRLVAAQQATPKAPEPTPAPEAPKSARVQEAERLQQWAKEHGEKVPEFTPELHPEEATRGPLVNTVAPAKPLEVLQGPQKPTIPTEAEAPTPEPIKPVEQPNTLAAAREATENNGTQAGQPTPAPTPEAPAGETFFQRLAREGAEKAKALVSEETGGEKYSEAFLHRTVEPAIKGMGEHFADLGKSLDRNLGLGFTHTKEGNKARASILEAKGRAVQEGHAFEAAMTETGAREKAPSFSKEEVTALQAWDNIHNGAHAPTAGENAALDLIQQKRKENFSRAQKLGLHFKDAEGEGLSRMFTPDPEAANAPGKAGSRSLAGAEKFFRSQKYDLPSDAYKAAKAAGLKPAYDNLYDMQAATQYAVEDSLNQRENIRAADKSGILTWVKNGDKPPMEKGTPLEDKIGTETRRLAVPKAIAGRFAAAKDGGYEAVQLLKDHERAGTYVRPGEDAPDDYAFAPSVFDKEGTYHGQEDTARAWNENLKAGRGDAVQELPKTLANLAIAQRYSMSLAHGVWGASTHLANNIGRALGFGTKDWPERFQALKNLGFVDTFTRANELREHIESGGKVHPELKDVADRVMATNPGTHFNSVLEKGHYADALNEFKHDNIAGGVGKLVTGFAKQIKDGIYHGALDSFDLSVRRDVAERQIRQGTPAETGTAEISKAGSTLSDVLGRHVNSPEFRNANLTAIGRILAPAYQLKAGTIKTVGSVLTNPNARAMVAGGVMLHTLTNAALQIALTKYNTGSVVLPNAQDLILGARTGLKNQAGKDQRVSIPTPMAYMIRQFFSGGKKAAEELAGSINPGITGAVEVAKNKDFYGNQIMPDDSNSVANFFRALGHMGKGAVPGSITSPMDQGPNDTRGLLNRGIQSVTGIHTGHPETSKAMEIAEEQLDANQPKGRNLKEQALYSAKQKWANEIRGANGDQAKEDAVVKEMQQNPAMGDKEIDSVFTRASRKQGLASIVLDAKMTPDTLGRMWDAATDEEKAVIRPGIEERLDRAKPDNDELQAAWDTLEKKLGAKP